MSFCSVVDENCVFAEGRSGGLLADGLSAGAVRAPGGQPR